jgi:hypothetical protein
MVKTLGFPIAIALILTSGGWVLMRFITDTVYPDWRDQQRDIADANKSFMSRVVQNSEKQTDVLMELRDRIEYQDKLHEGIERNNAYQVTILENQLMQMADVANAVRQNGTLIQQGNEMVRQGNEDRLKCEAADKEERKEIRDKLKCVCDRLDREVSMKEGMKP